MDDSQVAVDVKDNSVKPLQEELGRLQKQMQSAKLGWSMNPNPRASAAKPKSVVIPVKHLLLVKYLEEDSDGNLFMVGSIVQTLTGCIPEEQETYFKYRFNDFAASDDSFMFRRARSTIAEGNIPLHVVTTSVRLPLILDTEFHKFPFVTHSATCDIEMSTFEDKNTQIRPNIIIDKRYLDDPSFVYQDFVKVRDPAPHVMDRMKSYDFITYNPSVAIEYANKGGGYAPKMVIRFWLHEPVSRRGLNIVAPFIVIIILGTLNIFVPQDSSSLIGNTSSIALTLVFLLPLLQSESNSPMPFSLNDLLMFFVFAGLVVNCIKGFFYEFFYQTTFEPSVADTLHDAYYSNGLAYARDYLIPFLSLFFFLSSFFIPFVSYAQYLNLTRKIRKANSHQDVMYKKNRNISKYSNVRVRDETNDEKHDASKEIDISNHVGLKNSVHFGYVSEYDQNWR